MAWQRQEITVHPDQASPHSPSQTSCRLGDSNTWPAHFEEHYSRRFLLISSLTLKSCALKPSGFVSCFQRLCHQKDKILTTQSSSQPGKRSGIALPEMPEVSAPVLLFRAPPASDKQGRREAPLPPAVLHELQGQVQHEEQRANDSLPSCCGDLSAILRGPYLAFSLLSFN